MPRHAHAHRPLDADELERIRAFLAQGGARRYAVARDIAEERERERARRERNRPGPVAPGGLGDFDGLDLVLLLLHEPPAGPRRRPGRAQSE